ncbi:2-amino-4-hydroxy-6-hydroxymethyldihydropteridine diphosphokinase [Patescibacteria group bacterium]
MSKTAYLSLGSNIGRRSSNLKKALKLIEECGIVVSKKSKFYETVAVSKIKQRNFVNMCVEIKTTVSPQKLLQICQMIEREMGRDRKSPKKEGYEKPRIIDIDIIIYEKEKINQRNLKVPHPKMHERRFVLEPLNEIAPHLVHPVQQKTIKQLLNALQSTSIF